MPPEGPRDRARPLHPLPRGVVELYGLLAVLVVLIPEWMASGALQRLMAQAGAASLPSQAQAWRRLPELRLASMSLAELRLLAQQLGLGGYARLGRERLVGRLLQRIRRSRGLDDQDGRRPSWPWLRRRLRLIVAVSLLLITLVVVIVGSLLLL